MRRTGTYTTAEARKILNVSRNQLNIYHKRGVIRSIQRVPKGNHHFLKEDIHRLLGEK